MAAAADKVRVAHKTVLRVLQTNVRPRIIHLLIVRARADQFSCVLGMTLVSGAARSVSLGTGVEVLRCLFGRLGSIILGDIVDDCVRCLQIRHQ